MRSIFFVFGAILVFTPFAYGAVISNANISLFIGGPLSDYTLNVFQDPSATDITGMSFDFSGQTLSFVNETADEGSDWYLVSQSDDFTQASIQSAAFPLFARATSTGYESHDLTISSADFYLGVNTGSGFISVATPRRNIYGWVHLENDNGTLTMLGNAIAYDEQGIIVGTTQAIPEPATGLVLILGLPMALGRLRASNTVRDERGRIQSS